MGTLDDLKAAMRDWRTARKGGGSRGQALYDLNRWKGEQRKALDEEYNRRLAEIETIPDTPETGIPEAALDLISQAVREGASRSAIRVALGKQTLGEADEVIAYAQDRFQDKVSSGAEGAFMLISTGQTTGRGWPEYDVLLHATGETHKGVTLTSPPNATLKRAHLRIQPAPPGSVDILNQVWESGAAQEMFSRGK